MYNEEKSERNYFFRNLIVKILLILLFIFLLMWLIPMPNLNPVLDKIFAENINNMTEAAKGYFTISRLPSKEGETKTLTLREMLDNKMLIEFTDSDGKTCDLNKSYVEVTKKDGEYIFKTNLSCSKQEDYVIEYFGCYDVCSDNSCKSEPTVATEEVKEYRFYKVTEQKLIDKYLCKEGYTLSGTKCVLNTTVESKEDATLKCLTGYTYNEDTKMCEKELVEKEDATKTCKSGYTYSKKLDNCVKNGTSSVDALISYNCEAGTLNNDTKMCEITMRSEIPAEKIYTCSEEKLDGTKCIAEKPATPVYTCSEGTLNSNNKCDVKVTSTSPETCGYTNWVCSNITTTYQMGNSSTTTSTTKFLYKDASGKYVYQVCTRKYNCKAGTTTTSTVEKDIAKITSYKCNEGKLDGTKCVITKDATVSSYKCNAGTLRDNKCIIADIDKIEAKKEYSCKNGTLDGTKCIISKVEETNYIYKCSIGTLNETKCLIYVTDKKEPTYVCKESYTKAGTTCYKTESTSDIYDAEVTYKTVSNKAYKWSRSETLSGWTRTGETRTVKVNVTSK